MPQMTIDCNRVARLEPDMRLGPLQLFIDGLQFPDGSSDSRFWLKAYACCSPPHSYVTTQGPFLRVQDIREFARDCKFMGTQKYSKGALRTTEGALWVELTGAADGQLDLRIMISPYGSREEHVYYATISRDELKRVSVECQRILARYSYE